MKTTGLANLAQRLQILELQNARLAQKQTDARNARVRTTRLTVVVSSNAQVPASTSLRVAIVTIKTTKSAW